MRHILFLFIIVVAFLGAACADSGGMKAAPSPSSVAAASQAPNDEKAIIDLEKKSWEWFMKKDTETTRENSLQSCVFVSENGVTSLEENLAGFKNYDMTDLKMSGEKVIFPTPDTAIITYKSVSKVTSKGKDVSGTFYCSTVWVRDGGKWKQAIYNEIKAAK